VCGGEMKRGVPDPDDRRSCQAIPAFEDIELPVNEFTDLKIQWPMESMPLILII